jgi:hypothetical protein
MKNVLIAELVLKFAQLEPLVLASNQVKKAQEFSWAFS